VSAPPRRPALLHVVGARPNFVKLAPVVKALATRLPSARQVIVHTGQHYDDEMWRVFVEELGLPEPDHLLGVGSGSRDEQIDRVRERLAPILVAERPDIVVVAGDVNSTLAGAQAAVELGIPVAHVEAGLRSFDRSMPEEVNRVLVDQLSTWCFTHSPEAQVNLAGEGVNPERIHDVGNTMIDTLVRLRARSERSDVHERFGVPRGRYILVTLHRPALVDGPLLAEAVAALARISRAHPIVFPVHPRTQARLGLLPSEPGLHLVGPLGYVDFLALEAGALGVLTDSGGVQEETTFLGVPCFTLRDNTERPVTISQGTNRLLGLDIAGIDRIPELLVDGLSAPVAPAGWDGRAAERLADVLAAALLPEQGGVT
jgi:UDP-N-acetylglucosamine 2-epimerase (non-hydrolysing)